MEKRENNLKPCVHRPFQIVAYMDSWYMDQLLLTNLFKFSINIVKIIMKTKDRITYNPIFGKEMWILSIKDASKQKKSINWVNGYIIV